MSEIHSSEQIRTTLFRVNDEEQEQRIFEFSVDADKMLITIQTPNGFYLPLSIVFSDKDETESEGKMVDIYSFDCIEKGGVIRHHITEFVPRDLKGIMMIFDTVDYYGVSKVRYSFTSFLSKD